MMHWRWDTPMSFHLLCLRTAFFFLTVPRCFCWETMVDSHLFPILTLTITWYVVCSMELQVLNKVQNFPCFLKPPFSASCTARSRCFSCSEPRALHREAPAAHFFDDSRTLSSLASSSYSSLPTSSLGEEYELVPAGADAWTIRAISYGEEVFDLLAPTLFNLVFTKNSWMEAEQAKR